MLANLVQLDTEDSNAFYIDTSDNLVFTHADGIHLDAGGQNALAALVGPLLDG
jgi:hypothetical protein